jgi:hypothetical protein
MKNGFYWLHIHTYYRNAFPRNKMKYRDDKKAQRESETHKDKVEKAKRAANKVNHRDKPRNMRGEVMVEVGETVFLPKTEDGKQPLPVDTDGKEELTVVG